MIYIAICLWLFATGVGYYNSYFRWHLNNMVSWLRDQHQFVEEHNDYREEAYRLYNEFIPQIEEWIEESYGFIIPILVVQVLNSIMIFFALLGGFPVWLSFLVAVGNSALFVSSKILRQRRYTAEGICHGVKVIVDAINIQQTTNTTLDEIV